MGILFKKEVRLLRTFEPPPTPLPQRVLSGEEVNEQKECLLLTRLPSEIRNAIYCLVFGASADIEDEGKSREEDEGGLDESHSPLQSLRSSVEDGIGEEKKTPDMTLRTSGLDAKENGTPATQAVNPDDSAPNTPEPEPEQSNSAHPLSLLLTCRKISQEATILAFTKHTFNIASSRTTTFFVLRHSTLHLSSDQFSAITSLAFELPKEVIGGCHTASDFLSNAMLLFPTIQKLTLRVKKGKLAIQQAHMNDMFPSPSSGDHIKDAALKKYVPHWFRATIKHLIDGRSFSWQRGQKWRVEWPQFDSATYSVQSEYVGPVDGWQMMGVMSAEAAGVVDGVELCVCGSVVVRWVAAHLVQETGRKVEVGVTYYGDAEAEALKNMEIRLQPLEEGVKPLPVTWLQGGKAAVWDMDENYWDLLRARSGWREWRRWRYAVRDQVVFSGNER